MKFPGSPAPDPTVAAKVLLDRFRDQKDGCYNELVEMNVIQHVPSDFKGRRVLDAGAFHGTFSAIAIAHGAPFVLAVEPNPENFAKLCENVKAIPQIWAIRFALMDGSKLSGIVVEAGSISKVVYQGTGPSVPVMTLEQLLVSFFPRNDNNLVLKIDIEGGEFEVLFSAKPEHVRRFETIFAEFHGDPPTGPRDLEKLKAHVKDLGYSVVGEIKSQYWWDYDQNGKMIGCKKLPIETIKYKRG